MRRNGVCIEGLRVLYKIELEKLQDKVPPFPTEDAKRIIEEELGGSVDTMFKDFEDTPTAAASMAQVYRAVLPDGEEVAIKVQRLGIDQTVGIDLQIMLHLATLIKHHYKGEEGLSALDLEAILKEFGRAIRKELDFGIEAAHITRFATNFQSDMTIHVPKVYMDFSSRKVLTMEFIDRFKVTDCTKKEVQEQGIDPKVVASRVLPCRPPPGKYTSLESEPFAKKLVMERMNPQKVIKDMSNSVIETSTLIRDLPYTLNEMLTKIKQGDTKIKFEHTGIEPMIKTLNQVTNRITFAIVLASLAIGSALIVLSDIPHKWVGIPISVIGFVIAALIGFWLLISILRHGQM